MSSCEVDDNDRASIFVHLAINLVLVPLVRQGEKKSDIVKGLSTALLQQLALHLDHPNPVMQAAVQDVRDACLYLLALVQPASRNPKSYLAMDRIAKSSTGCKLLMKNAVSQSRFYADAELQSRRFEQCEKTFLPRMQELEAELRGKSQQAITSALEELPRWQDGLPQGAGNSVVL